jgi:hypothetical protein
VTLEDVEQVIRKVDKNGDGAIDYDEFTKVTPVTPHPKPKVPPPAAESPWRSFMRRRCSCPPVQRGRRRRLVLLGPASPHRSSWTSSFLRSPSDSRSGDPVAQSAAVSGRGWAAAGRTRGCVVHYLTTNVCYSPPPPRLCTPTSDVAHADTDMKSADTQPDRERHRARDLRLAAANMSVAYARAHGWSMEGPSEGRVIASPSARRPHPQHIIAD